MVIGRSGTGKSTVKQINDSGVTIVMVTHSLGLVPFSTRAYSMDKGKLNLTHSKK